VQNVAIPVRNDSVGVGEPAILGTALAFGPQLLGFRNSPAFKPVDVPKHEHLLAEVFRQQLGSVWQLVGGRPSQHHDATPEGAVGIFATNGTWNDHCWLEGNGGR
jgi:hypothetical protein